MNTKTTLGALLAMTCVGAGTAWAQGVEHVLWRFELDSPVAGREVGVGPDGAVYASDDVQLYAINADGTLRWTRPGLGDGTPISFLADGAIVVGHGETVWALEADGSTRWSFTFDGNGGLDHIEAGPSVGPDGNIYAMTSVDGDAGLGVFSLTPGGDLRWATDADPSLYNINGETGGPIFFASDRLYFHFNNTADTPPHDYGFDLDGNQTLHVDFACTSVVRTDPFDRLVLSRCGIEVIDPYAGEVVWTVETGGTTMRPAIDEDGGIYTSTFLGSLMAITPDGEVAWTSDSAVDVASILAARSDVGRVLYRAPGFGAPTKVAVADSADGTMLHVAELLQIEGQTELVESDRAAMSADGSVAYFSTRFTSLAAPGAVYAVDFGEADGCVADFNGDGSLDVLDFVAFQDAFTSGDAGADANGDGALNILDFVAFQGLFQDGCA